MLRRVSTLLVSGRSAWAATAALFWALTCVRWFDAGQPFRPGWLQALPPVLLFAGALAAFGAWLWLERDALGGEAVDRRVLWTCIALAVGVRLPLAWSAAAGYLTSDGALSGLVALRLRDAREPFVIRGLAADWPLVRAGLESADAARAYLAARARDGQPGRNPGELQLESCLVHRIEGSSRDVEEVPDDLRSAWVTSHDISSEWHVRMQAAFQKYTSMGISKTINLPNEATIEDVEDAYMQAFATGCKGIAVYRDGSRDAQVLSTGKTDSEPDENAGALHDARSRGEAPVLAPQTPETLSPGASLAEARNGRPNALSGVTRKLATGHGPMYVTMNDDEFGPRECFVILGKPGGTAAAFSDALGRMITMALTHGASPAEVVHQLRGIQDGHPAGVGPNATLSVPDGVARAMAEHYLIEASLPDTRELPIIGACPDCGSGLTRQEGCVTCHSCGYSKCS